MGSSTKSLSLLLFLFLSLVDDLGVRCVEGGDGVVVVVAVVVVVVVLSHKRGDGDIPKPQKYNNN